MQEVVIVGTGGMGREAHQIASDENGVCPTWNVLGFLDDNKSLHGQLIHGLPILGGSEWAQRRSEVAVFLAIGNPSVRQKLSAKLAEWGCRFPTLVSPTTKIGQDVSIGEGTIVATGAILTTDIRVGRFALINTGSIVSHDCQLDDFSTLSPGAVLTGAVHLHEGCEIGAGATVIPGKSVGAWSVVGAGAVVTTDLPARCTAVGVPARIVKR